MELHKRKVSISVCLYSYNICKTCKREVSLIKSFYEPSVSDRWVDRRDFCIRND